MIAGGGELRRRQMQMSPFAAFSAPSSRDGVTGQVRNDETTNIGRGGDCLAKNDGGVLAVNMHVLPS